MDRSSTVRRLRLSDRRLAFVLVIGMSLILGSPLPGIGTGSVYAQDVDECSAPATDFDDVTPITDDLSIDDDLEIGQTEVFTDISHTYIGDIEMELTSPEGTVLLLFENSGFGADDILVTWSDDGVEHGSDAFTCDCLMQPSGLATMSSFDTEFSSGDWSLGLIDEAAIDSGTLNEWCLRLWAICEAEPIAAFTCEADGRDVEITWIDSDDYTELTIFRDGEEIDTLDEDDDASYSDLDVTVGFHRYELRVYSEEFDCFVDATCDIAVGLICVTSGDAIADTLDPVESIIDIVDAGEIDIVEMYVDISHTYVGDLLVTAESPAGTSITLHDGDLGQFADDIDLRFSDAGIPYDDTDLTCGCLMMPEGPGTLADFSDEEREGEWTLTVEDTVAVDDGELNRWCLVFDEEAIDDEVTFLRGDADVSGSLSALVDALAMLNFSFGGGDPLECLEAADVDDSGNYSALVDALYLLSYQFSGGDAPPAPFPDCGPLSDTDDEDLGCETLPDCT